MRLEACPLCSLVRDGPHLGYGDYCVKVKFGNNEAVVLIEHEGSPSPEAVKEAVSLMENRIGMLEDIRQVPGHWGLRVMDGDWTASGKSSAYEEGH